MSDFCHIFYFKFFYPKSVIFWFKIILAVSYCTISSYVFMSLCLNVGLFVCLNTFFFSVRLSVCLVVRLSDRLHVFLFPYFSVTSLLWAICPCLLHKHILRNSGIPLPFSCFYFTSNVLSYPSYLCLYDEVIRSAQILGSVFSLTKHQPYAWLLYKGCFASIA